MIVREGMTVVSFGLVIGVPLGTAGAGLIRHLLYGSSASDFGVYASAVVIVAALGLLACWIPAQRAARLDPVNALREE